jgi:ankyrin repeat protein
LLKAISSGNVEEAIAALTAGANPNAKGKDGMTALMLAAQSGKTDLVQKLLDLGADPNATNKAGQTALHLAPPSAHLKEEE